MTSMYDHYLRILSNKHYLNNNNMYIWQVTKSDCKPTQSLQSVWVTCHVSDLDISSYFISFIVWIADVGQVCVNVTLIIALIINFTS